MDLFQVYAQWVWGQTTIPAVVEFTNNFFQLFEDCETPNQANIVGIEAHEPMIVDLCIEKITWLLRTEALGGNSRMSGNWTVYSTKWENGRTQALRIALSGNSVQFLSWEVLDSPADEQAMYAFNDVLNANNPKRNFN